MLSLLFTYALAFATTDTKIRGCWRGEVSGGRIEIILSKNPDVADAAWFDDGKGRRLLADLSCSKKLPARCAIEDDGGSFNLDFKRSLRMNYRGRFARVATDAGDRLALEKGRVETSTLLEKIADKECSEKTEELLKIFGVGP